MNGLSTIRYMMESITIGFQSSKVDGFLYMTVTLVVKPRMDDKLNSYDLIDEWNVGDTDSLTQKIERLWI